MKHVTAMLACCLVLPAHPLQAHHSAPAFFDTRGFISVAGTISGTRLENPHSYYRVTADDGTSWAWESASSWTALAKLGWSKETLPEGARVRISGIPALVEKPIARFDHIAVYDAGAPGFTEIYGLEGNAEWQRAVREIGSACTTGIEDCRRLNAQQMAQLNARFGDIGIW